MPQCRRRAALSPSSSWAPPGWRILPRFSAFVETHGVPFRDWGLGSRRLGVRIGEGRDLNPFEFYKWGIQSPGFLNQASKKLWKQSCALKRLSH